MLDGTDVDSFRQSLMDANHQHTREFKKTRIPRFGKNAGKIATGKSSQKSNMLEAMSDVMSMKTGKLDEMSVHDSIVDGSQWRPEEKDDENSDDSDSAMIDAKSQGNQSDANMK